MYQKKLERRSTAPWEDKAEHTLRVHASHRRASRASASSFVFSRPRQKTSKRQRGVTGMAQKLDTAQMHKYWTKTSASDVDHLGVVDRLQLRHPALRASSSTPSYPRLPARLLHGRAGLADRLRRPVLLERERAEQDRRRIRRRRKTEAGETQHGQHNRRKAASSAISARSTAATPAASSSSRSSSAILEQMGVLEQDHRLLLRVPDDRRLRAASASCRAPWSCRNTTSPAAWCRRSTTAWRPAPTG